MDAPGASVAGCAGVQVPSTAFGSVTLTWVRVTLPVFSTVMSKVRIVPALIGPL